MIPGKKDLELGKTLVLEFARQYLPDEFDKIRRIFSKRGAYGQFKELLHRKRALDRGYEFENKATEDALREWCEAHGLTIREGDHPTPEPDQR